MYLTHLKWFTIWNCNELIESKLHYSGIVYSSDGMKNKVKTLVNARQRRNHAVLNIRTKISHPD